MKTEQEIREQVKLLETAIEQLKNAKVGFQPDGIYIDSGSIKSIIARHEGSITALKWVLNDES